MITATVIQETTNYTLFKTKKGNRRIIPGMVERLAKSITKHNLLKANPIIVNKKMEVIDGQHRLQAAQRLDIPIHYVVFDPASLEEIQLLNANVRVWSSIDFLDSYVSTGRKPYILFKQFWDRYSLFTYSCVLTLLGSPVDLIRRAKLHQDFKEGLFSIPDFDRSVEMADDFMRAVQYVSHTVSQSVRFYEALFKVYIRYPSFYNRLIEKLALYGKKIYRDDAATEYLRQFELLLNEGNYSKPIRLY